MVIEANKAIAIVAKMACMDFTKAKLPWKAVNKTDVTGEAYTEILDNEGKTVCIFPDGVGVSDGDFDADSICRLANICGEVNKETGEPT